jgi:hypothetical protein
MPLRVSLPLVPVALPVPAFARTVIRISSTVRRLRQNRALNWCTQQLSAERSCHSDLTAISALR